MSTLYGTLSSDRATNKTQQGTRQLIAHVAGWRQGIRVEAQCLDASKLKFKVYGTGGSNNPQSSRLLLEIDEDE